MLEKYYREALSNIRDYASERKQCSLYLETIERMALDALQGKNLTSKSSGQEKTICEALRPCEHFIDGICTLLVDECPRH